VTAINVIKQKTAVHMLTDGASWIYPGSYYVGPPVLKAWPLPHLNAVLACRGPLQSPPVLADLFSSCGASTYDELKKAALAVMEAAMSSRLYEDVVSGASGNPIELVIAGWSETVGPDAFVIQASAAGNEPIDRFLSENKPWILKDTGAAMMAPSDDAIQKAALAAMPPTNTCADDMDPVRDGLAILNAQRDALIAVEHSASHGMVTVGGFAQLTTVTADAITTRIIHRWPYEIGEAA
jgi:hypothetical protein